MSKAKAKVHGHVWNRHDRCALCGTGRDWGGSRGECPIAALSLDSVAAVASGPEGRALRQERARARWVKRAAQRAAKRGAA